MSYKFFNMTILFLTLIIVGAVIASPVDYSTNTFGSSLLKIALESMNNNSPNNHGYRSGSLLEAKKISTKDDLPTMEILVLLEVDCIEESPCPQEVCNMLVTEDESKNLIVDDQSKECNDILIEQNLHRVNGRFKREAIKVDVSDPLIQNFVNKGTDRLDKYKIPGKPLVTTMVNATKEDIPDGTKYVIYFNIVEPTCITSSSGITTSCSIHDDSLARLCTINVDEKNKLKFVTTEVTATCEKEQHILVPNKIPTPLE